MDFRLIDDEYVWNIPLARVENAQFLQSWEWGIFQQTFGRAVRRLQIVEGETVMAALQLFEYPLPFGKKYLYAPRGPVILSSDPDALSTILHLVHRACRDLARETGAMFARLESVTFYSHILPPSPQQNLGYGRARKNMRIDEKEEGKGRDGLLEELKSFGVQPGHSVQPMDELAVFATSDEDDLLAAMHEKTRYNIRLAAKHGVRARLIEQPEYARRVFPFFWELMQETARRQKIHTHSKEYYERMVDLLVPKGVLKLMVAEYDNKIIAAHLLSVFGDTVYYLHGGSSYADRQLMVPYLLHWEGIRLAKRLEKNYYNFGGISPPSPVLTDVPVNNERNVYSAKSWLSRVGFGGQGRHKGHPWQNLTRFKEGFMKVGETGERVHYIGTLDLVFQPMWYRIYKAGRYLQSFTRIR